MSLRRYYLALIGLTLTIMIGSILLIGDTFRATPEDLSDIAWKEHLRENIINSITPLRDRILSANSRSTSIVVASEHDDEPIVPQISESERQLAIEVLSNLHDEVVNTLVIIREEAGESSMAPVTIRLLQIQNHLYFLTLTYIDKLMQVCRGDTEVLYSEIGEIERALDTYNELMYEELDNLGIAAR